MAEQRADPRFEALRETLEDASAGYESAARRAAPIADVSIYATVLLAAIALTALLLGRQREEARRVRQEAGRRSQERFRSLVQNAPDIISIYAPDGKVRYVSLAVERMLGYGPEERLGKSTFDLVHPDDFEWAKKTMAEDLREPGARVSVEVRVRHKDGSWRHVEATGTNMLDDPHVRGIVLNSGDVTERKRASEALRESEERYGTVVEQAADALFVHDLQGNLVDVNRQACASLGYAREELRSMSVADDIEKNFDPGALESLWERLATEGPRGL